MRKRIFRAMLLNSVLILLASALLILGVLYSYFGVRLEAELAAETDYIAQGVLMGGTDYLESLSPGTARITWIAADGTVLYDSREDASRMENHGERKEVRQALRYGTGRDSRYSQTLAQKTVYYAQRLADGTVIRSSSLQYTVWVLVLQILQPLCLVLFAALGLAALLGGRLSRQILRPLNDIDLKDPALLPGYEELDPLFERIRSQNRLIQEQMAQMRRKQEEFSAMTENMNEGLLVVDEKMRLLSHNSAALRLLHTTLPVGGGEVSAFDLDRSAAFQSALEDALHGKRCEKILEREGRCLQLLASPVVTEGEPQGAIVVFWDATEREQREGLRREFTANVSHELKTPLTSILGTAEILENGMVKTEDTAHFAGNIRKEAQRLINLVSDIIRLSQLDEADVEMERQSVELFALAQRVEQQLRPAAEAKGLNVTLRGEPATVSGVPQILEEMLYNLWDNAVAYNRENGEIQVTVEKQAHTVAVTVADSGVGIPQGEQERVFERFYRLDKSRSSRGTGLGLSIVKHGAAFHHAQVRLESKPNSGTRVTLVFPLEKAE